MRRTVFEKMRIKIGYKFLAIGLNCMPERFRLYVLVEAKEKLEALR